VTFSRCAKVAAAVVAAALGALGLGGWAVAAKADKPKGSVAGLYPGGTATLEVSVTNTNGVAVAVESVSVEATDAGPGCPASVLTFTSPSPGQVIGRDATATVPVGVSMAAQAPDDCQGATFPLRHTVTGSRAD
jgi:hypothetical protein